MRKFVQFSFFLILFAGCKLNSGKNSGSHFGSPDYTVINQENKSRDTWQKPNLVIEKLGDISQKTIADIGAGTGYFTFRLALKANKVIAIEIDPNMIALIDAFSINLPEELQKKVETRLATPSNSSLEKGEADIIVIINTITYIKEKERYLKHLYNILPENGQLVIVDYKSKALPIKKEVGQFEESVSYLESLASQCGYNSIDVDVESLDYQYILMVGK